MDLLRTSRNEIVAKLVVDESYKSLREVRPADGWAYADDVPFKVSRDGTVGSGQMEDKPTHVVISKQENYGK